MAANQSHNLVFNRLLLLRGNVDLGKLLTQQSIGSVYL